MLVNDNELVDSNNISLERKDFTKMNAKVNERGNENRKVVVSRNRLNTMNSGDNDIAIHYLPYSTYTNITHRQEFGHIS